MPRKRNAGLTLVEQSVLLAIADEGGVPRVRTGKYDSCWVWKVGGKARSGPVDTLLAKGFAMLNDNNRDEAVLSPLGASVLEEVRRRA
jgi:hypothetical protein